MTHNGKEAAQGSVFFLRPLVYKDIQVTLKRSTPPKEAKHHNPGALNTAVRLIISRNPVKKVVFVLFPVMIAGIGMYMVMTWRPRPADKPNSL